MSLETHLSAEILFSDAVPWFLFLLNLMSMQSFLCWGMQPGLYQTFVEGNLSLCLSRLLRVLFRLKSVCFFPLCFLFKPSLMGSFIELSANRQKLHFLHWSVLYILMMTKSLQMLAGRCHTYQMVPMIKFRLLLRLVSVHGLLNF